MLFGVVFKEKNAKKNKKKLAVGKTFCLISPQGEHFRTYLKQVWEAPVQDYNFHLFSSF